MGPRLEVQSPPADPPPIRAVPPRIGREYHPSLFRWCGLWAKGGRTLHVGPWAPAQDDASHPLCPEWTVEILWWQRRRVRRGCYYGKLMGSDVSGASNSAQKWKAESPRSRYQSDPGRYTPSVSQSWEEVATPPPLSISGSAPVTPVLAHQARSLVKPEMSFRLIKSPSSINAHRRRCVGRGGEPHALLEPHLRTLGHAHVPPDPRQPIAPMPFRHSSP